MSAASQRFAENLKRELAQSPLSDGEVAVRAEMHRTQIGKLVKGGQVPRLDTLVKLAGALGVKPAVLVEGITWTPAIPSKGKFKRSPAS